MKNVSGSGYEYVLDSFAVIAYLKEEPGGEIVRELFEYAQGRVGCLALSAINLSECLYTLERCSGATANETVLNMVRALGIHVVSADKTLAISAARFKASNRISLADAFAAALAVEKGATLVTGDPEFKALEKTIPIRWLPQRRREQSRAPEKSFSTKPVSSK